MILHRKIWVWDYFSCIKSNLFIIAQICLALFLINHQVGYISWELGHLANIIETDSDTYLFQYSLAACGLFNTNLQSGDYTKACKKIRSLPGIEDMGELFDTSFVSVDGDSQKYPDEQFQINIMDSIVTSAVTYNVEEGRWLNESDRNGEVIHAVLGGAIAKRHKIGEIMNIELDTGETYEIEIVGTLTDHCNILDMHTLSINRNINSFMVESENNIFINNNKIFNTVKNKDLEYSAAHCIVKLDKNADKRFLSNYGKLVSFVEMEQETKDALYEFIKNALVEGIIWTIVIIFGIIATSYLVGKKQRYTWGIYLMLGEKPKKLLKIHMVNNCITYLVGALISLLINKIYYRKEVMYFMTDISMYQIIFDVIFLIIMMIISLISSLYILKIKPKEILAQTKE